MKKIKHYTIRRRKTCRRWELIIRDKDKPKGFGSWIYGGMYAEFDEAIQHLKDDWGLEPSEEDLHTSALIKANKNRMAKESSLGSNGETKVS